MKLTKEAFNAALNEASIELRAWNGGLFRKASTEFNVPGVEGKMQVEVSVTPEASAMFGEKPGVEIVVAHYKEVSRGTYIHWDVRGTKEVDIGFDIDRIPEMVRLATPTTAEMAATVKDASAAIAGYGEEMGIDDYSRPRIR